MFVSVFSSCYKEKQSTESLGHLDMMGNNIKVSKFAKIRNRYNQVPHLTQDTNPFRSDVFPKHIDLNSISFSKELTIFQHITKSDCCLHVPEIHVYIIHPIYTAVL